MYDDYILSEEYDVLKETVADILNGEDETTNIEELVDHIQEIYEDGKLSARQYDELMDYVHEMLLERTNGQKRNCRNNGWFAARYCN